MKAQSRLQIIAYDTQPADKLKHRQERPYFLATYVNKGRSWPKSNMNKPRGMIDQGIPGPVLWKLNGLASTSK